MLTLAAADIHGDPALLARILDHAGFSPSTHRLVVLGDAVVYWPARVPEDGTLALLSLIADCGGELLVGKHDAWHLTGLPLPAPEPLHVHHPRAFRELRAMALDGRLGYAAEAGGFLLLHSCLSVAAAARVAGLLGRVPSGAAGWADGLNGLWSGLLADASDGPFLGVRDPSVAETLLGFRSPLWQRPLEGEGNEAAPYALPQAVGHSPASDYSRAELDTLGRIPVALVDAFPGRGIDGFRYALVGEGWCEVVSVAGNAECRVRLGAA